MSRDDRPYFLDRVRLAHEIDSAEPALKLVDLRKEELYLSGHLPGAHRLDYADLVFSRPPVGGLLPDEASLSRLFSSIGIRADSWVVAYDDEGGGRAGRLLWTLDVLGHEGGVSVLDGGFDAWRDAGGPTDTAVPATVASDYRAQVRDGALVDADYILRALGREDLVLIDTRTLEEFNGTNVRAARGGHIPGAVHFNWVDAMDAKKRLLPLDELRLQLASLGVTQDKEVIAYCQTHHRSSHTFALLKALGFARAKGYAGAWSEWGNRTDTPIEH